MSMLGSILPGLAHLQNAHPVVVHYPIALLTGAALLYTLAWIIHSEGLARGAYWMLILGTLSAVAAAATGYYAASGVMVSNSVREHLLEPHEDLMVTALGLSVVLAVWAIVARPFPRKGRWGFVLMFWVLGAIIAKGADYGGRMVYDYNAGGQACSQPIEFTR
jgi:uncharacterized membrane protein